MMIVTKRKRIIFLLFLSKTQIDMIDEEYLKKTSKPKAMVTKSDLIVLDPMGLYLKIGGSIIFLNLFRPCAIMDIKISH